MSWNIGPMAGHLVSAPVSGFHIGEGTDVELAHFWSQCPLVNGVRSWQLIIKHDLTQRFHCRTFGVYPSFCVSHQWGHRCGTSPFLEPGSTCEWCQKLTIDYKTWFDTSVLYPDTWCPPAPVCPGSTFVEALMWNGPTSGARVHLWMVSEVGNWL